MNYFKAFWSNNFKNIWSFDIFTSIINQMMRINWQGKELQVSISFKVADLEQLKK